MLPDPNLTGLVVYLFKNALMIKNVDINLFGNICNTPTISTTDPALSKPFALINLGVNPNFLEYTSTI